MINGPRGAPRSGLTPKTPEAVARGWLQAMLDVYGWGAVVDHVEHDTLVRGAGTKLRLKVRYAENPRDVPATLWIKAGWEEHSGLMEQAGVYVREARFYAELSQDAQVCAPRCFAACWDDDGTAAIVMEDLLERGAELWDCRVARSVADVRAMIDTLARLHARWWEDPALLAIPFVDISMRSSGPMAEWPRANGATRLNEVLAGPRGEGLPPHVRDGERIERAFWKMVRVLETAQGGCLLHGDPHPGNAFSDAGGAAGLFDWQTVARGPWAYDIAYMLVTALSVDDRRLNERDLIAYYLDRLSSNGVAKTPSPDAAWDEYRRHIAYPLLIWPTNHTTHQSEENIRALTYRLGIAADDFGFFDLWNV